MKTRLVLLSLVLSTVAYAQGVGYGLSSSAGAGSGVSTAIQKGDGAGGFTPAVTDTDFASTSYVGTQVSGLYWKQACKYATNAALATNVYANGSSGVGATLTGFAFGAVSVDGSTPSVGDRILVKNETAGEDNGVYTVTAVGSGAAFYILTRATDFDQTVEINNGDTVPIISGTANAESNWTLTAGGAPTMGSTTLTLTRQIDSTLATLTGSQALTNKTYNGNTFTAGTGTLTIAAGKTTTVNKTIVFDGTDSTTMTFPSTTATIARTDAANTFTGHQTIEGVTSTGASGTGKFLFDTGPTLAAGTTTIAPLTFGAGGAVLTSPVTGAVEADAAGMYFTGNTTSGREQVSTVAQYLMTGDGNVSNTATITDFFPANSSFSTVTNGIYEIVFEVFWLKTTAGTMVWTVTNTQNYTNFVGFVMNNISSGMGATGAVAGYGLDGTTSAAAAFPVSSSVSNGVEMFSRIYVLAECGTAGNIRLRGTPSAGTFTARRGSKYTVRRLGAASVGTFAP